MSQPQITPMSLDDYDEVYALWRQTEGVWISEADSRERIGGYLARNPGLSCVARAEDRRLIGALMCGHDGRRGVLYHLAVDPQWRRRGVGRALVEHCVAGLNAQGIEHVILFVLKDNPGGLRFWEALGWSTRDHVVSMLK